MSDLDEGRLAAWLERAVPGFAAPLRLEKIAHGQSNPSYRMESAAGRYVLRRKPFGTLLPSAHQIEREYQLMRALHPTGYPVPRTVALCEDAGVVGAAFYLMELIDGRVFVNGTLPDLAPAGRRAIYEAMVDRLADLHAVDPVAAGLGGWVRPGNYFERQVGRWTRQYRAAQTDDVAQMEWLIDWLARTIPAQDRTAIVHGDYRIDNMIFAGADGAAGRPAVAAVLDWELATLGDPLGDVSYLAMNWLLPVDGGAGLAGHDLGAAGIPTLAEAMDRYCARTGRAGLPDLAWLCAFNLFRLAAILQGIKKRRKDGNASSDEAEWHIARIVPLARAAWEQARLAGAPAPA